MASSSGGATNQPTNNTAETSTANQGETKPEIKSETKVDASAAQPKAVDDTANKNENLFDFEKHNILNDVAVTMTIEVGRAQIKIRDLINLTKGSVVELNKLAGDPVDVYVNGKLISTGSIITANGRYCVRLMAVSEQQKTTTDGHKTHEQTKSAEGEPHAK